jgi:hypothetical protein
VSDGQNQNWPKTIYEEETVSRYICNRCLHRSLNFSSKASSFLSPIICRPTTPTNTPKSRRLLQKYRSLSKDSNRKDHLQGCLMWASLRQNRPNWRK